MTRSFLLVALLFTTSFTPASAALRPEHQNANDLDVLVTFIKKYPRVAGTLKSIDMQQYVIYFDTACKAEFERQNIDRPLGWTGPLSPLLFSQSNCKLD